MPTIHLRYRVHRSRRRKGRDNASEFMLVHEASSTVLLGAGYTANLATIPEFVERERPKHSFKKLESSAQLFLWRKSFLSMLKDPPGAKQKLAHIIASQWRPDGFAGPSVDQKHRGGQPREGAPVAHDQKSG